MPIRDLRINGLIFLRGQYQVCAASDLGSVCARVRSSFRLAQTPQQNHPISFLHEPLYWSAKRDPKAKMLHLQSFLRKGVSLGYAGSIQELKDRKSEKRTVHLTIIHRPYGREYCRNMGGLLLMRSRILRPESLWHRFEN